MVKYFAFIVFLSAIVNTSTAAFTNSKTGRKKTGTSLLVVQQAAITNSLNLNLEAYEQWTGKHLTWLERIAFKWTQKQARKNFGEEKQSKQFNLTGFLVGFVSGIAGALFGAFVLSTGILGFVGIGLLFSVAGISVSRIFSKDNNLHKWAMIGLATYLGVALLFVIGVIIAFLSCGCFG